METKTILVLMCFGCGIIGSIIAFIGLKIKSNKIALGLLFFSIIVLFFSNLFMYKTILSKEEQINDEVKSIELNTGKKEKVDLKETKKESVSLDGLVKIKEERNKQSSGH